MKMVDLSVITTVAKLFDLEARAASAPWLTSSAQLIFLRRPRGFRRASNTG